MASITAIKKAIKTKPGYLKFYMSHTAYFLKGGYLIDLPVEGFHKFVFTQVQFIEQGKPDPGYDNPYGDTIIVNAGDAGAYSQMITTKIASIKSRT